MASVYTHTQKLLHTEHLHTVLLHMASVCTHSKLFKQGSLYTQRSFYTQQAFTQRSFYTQQAFTHSKRLHTEHLRTVLLHMASVYTHRETFTQRRFYTQRSFYTQQAFTHKIFYTQQAFTEKVFTQRSFLVHNQNRNCSSKTGSRRKSEKKTILKHCLKGILKGKLVTQNQKLRKSANKSLLQP